MNATLEWRDRELLCGSQPIAEIRYINGKWIGFGIFGRELARNVDKDAAKYVIERHFGIGG